jgi:quercetin dioxygenase-like cupin family protein
VDQQPVTRVTLADYTFSPALDVGHVEFRRITLAPGLAPGAHTHNGPVIGTVVSGTVVMQVRGGPVLVLNPGDPFHEPAGTVIERFDAGEAGAVFDAWFPLPAGEVPELIMV